MSLGNDGLQKKLTSMRGIKDGHVRPVLNPRPIKDRMGVSLGKCIRCHSEYAFRNLIYLRHFLTLSNLQGYSYSGAPNCTLAHLEKPCDFGNRAMFIIPHTAHLIPLTGRQGRGPTTNPTPFARRRKPFLGPF